MWPIFPLSVPLLSSAPMCGSVGACRWMASKSCWIEFLTNARLGGGWLRRRPVRGGQSEGSLDGVQTRREEWRRGAGVRREVKAPLLRSPSWVAVQGRTFKYLFLCTVPLLSTSQSSRAVLLRCAPAPPRTHARFSSLSLSTSSPLPPALSRVCVCAVAHFLLFAVLVFGAEGNSMGAASTSAMCRKGASLGGCGSGWKEDAWRVPAWSCVLVCVRVCTCVWLNRCASAPPSLSPRVRVRLSVCVSAYACSRDTPRVDEESDLREESKASTNEERRCTRSPLCTGALHWRRRHPFNGHPLSCNERSGDGTLSCWGSYLDV